MQEQGVGVLFAAFGLLSWTESDASRDVIHSPLVMVSVQLTRESALAPFKMNALDEAQTLESISGGQALVQLLQISSSA